MPRAADLQRAQRPLPIAFQRVNDDADRRNHRTAGGPHHRYRQRTGAERHQVGHHTVVDVVGGVGGQHLADTRGCVGSRLPTVPTIGMAESTSRMTIELR
jgi:hypothetical protein